VSNIRVSLRRHRARPPLGHGANRSERISCQWRHSCDVRRPNSVLTLRQTTFRIPSTTLTAEDRSVALQSPDSCSVERFAAIGRAGIAFSSLLPLHLCLRHGKPERQCDGLHAEAANLWSGERTESSGTSSEGRCESRFKHSSRSDSDGTLLNAQRGRASSTELSTTQLVLFPSNPIQECVMEQDSVTDLQHLANVRYPFVRVAAKMHSSWCG